ncbi:MAG: sensor histidine kinase [Dermatophilaceae bacterium]
MAGASSAAVARFFAVDDPWVRPAPTTAERRSDVWLALGFWAVAAVGMELARSFGLLDPSRGGPSQPVVVQHLAVASGTLILAWRRRHPLTVAALSAADMLCVGVAMPVVTMQFTMQVAYFFALYSGVAHARDRRHMVLVVGAIVLAMTSWVALSFAVGNAVDQYLNGLGDAPGVLSPAVAAVLYAGAINVIYFGGAIWLGQSAWNSARDHARVASLAATIAEQATRLRDQAVVEERLRIARELHDVVAHHVSVMGVQAAGARRLVHSDPDRAAAAMASVEVSSRDAVTQMRALLGTLRTSEPTRAAVGEGPPGQSTSGNGSTASARDRAPQPGLAELPGVVEAARDAGLQVSYTVVGEAVAIARVPPEVGLSIHRIVQEALTNVRRHSTASQASVVVRVTARYAEAEVLDDGRPRTGTSGTGLGTLGIRERLASHGGTSEIGPRATGGYRVRVRFPLVRATEGAVR